MRIWTTYLNYKSTSEGRSFMACIASASSEFDAIAKFEEKFGQMFAMGCSAEQGLVRNKVTKLIFSKAALDEVEKSISDAATGEVMLHGCLHLSSISGTQADLLLG